MRYQKITISGMICTGKSTLFAALKDKLRWPTVSSGAYFRKYAREHGLNLNAAEEQSQELTIKVDTKVREQLHTRGHLLVDAWLGGILAEGCPDVLKILLVAENKVRYARFAKRERVTLSQAQIEVTKRDNDWFNRVSHIHKRSDFFDKKNYDLVIDTSHCSEFHILSLVLSTLNSSP